MVVYMNIQVGGYCCSKDCAESLSRDYGLKLNSSGLLILDDDDIIDMHLVGSKCDKCNKILDGEVLKDVS